MPTQGSDRHPAAQLKRDGERPRPVGTNCLTVARRSRWGPVPIALLHAYRVANRGDGWLVELSRQLVREATGQDPEIYALDPAGMGPTARAVLPPPLRPRAAVAVALSASDRAARLVDHIVDLPEPDSVDAVVGIGGGYLRSGDAMHEAVFRAHHLPQLRLIARAGARGAYLPVSVGPFRRGLGRIVRRELAQVAWIGARDNRTARYLGGHARVRRTPDLAACHLGVTRPRLVPGDPNCVGVALRALRNSSLGPATVEELRRRGFRVQFGVQSSAGRTNDDRSFYRELGVESDAQDFGALIGGDGAGPGVILAGRLHAALAAIAAGRPTIHLGYERKSAGAFADLGLSDYVVDAWTGDPGRLADLVVRLAADPQPYWERLASRFDRLGHEWGRLVDDVATLAGRADQPRPPLVPVVHA